MSRTGTHKNDAIPTKIPNEQTRAFDEAVWVAGLFAGERPETIGIPSKPTANISGKPVNLGHLVQNPKAKDLKMTTWCTHNWKWIDQAAQGLSGLGIL